jgi:hypothetical protein
VGGYHSVLRTQEKIKSVRCNQLHGVLDMKTLLELNSSQNFAKRAWARLTIPFKKVKMFQLEQATQLSKL